MGVLFEASFAIDFSRILFGNSSVVGAEPSDRVRFNPEIRAMIPTSLDSLIIINDDNHYSVARH